jgi:hypothetical protein
VTGIDGFDPGGCGGAEASGVEELD